jgi:cytochrome P450
MRFNPQNHVLFRLCVADTKIAVGTPRETVIKKGTLVFASTLSAMFDDEGPFKQPKEFRLNRDPSKYLFFGYDGHECLGRHLVPLVLQEVLMRLLKLEELRRDNNDQFDPIELLPEHFLLEFNPGR